MPSAVATNRAREIFHDAVERFQPNQWPAYLDSACQGDDGLRRQVERLLAAHSQLNSFMGQPAAGPAATIDQPTERIGAMIGPYKLLEQIGEGGMGLVYMAEQQHPVRRLVALKIIKPGMDSKQVIARFEAERQALAMMDHSNIAKVLEAGTIGGEGPGTSDQVPASSSLAPGSRPLAPSAGRPYFVMELVRGLPINEFCDQKRLSLRERLELFILVCHAIQHAHQKGIIHRDLKPTNVLVTLADTIPVPKVIDFGIAKALGQSLTDRTLHTGYAQLIGTPLYMSPEQAELNQFGVDTRSDVYSLGVMLYELLTGTTPFDKDRLKSATFDEMRRIIREEEPETVSARLAKTRGNPGVPVGREANHSSEAASNPKSKIQNLKSFAELDWIVSKSLEKDRSRRYESASALAADIQCYLSDEPVLACPPTTMYRFQKFAKKHKPALATAAAIAVCLFLGTTVSAWQAVRATTAEAQANANEAQAKGAAAAEAQQRQRAEVNEQKANQQRSEAQQQRDEVKALADRLQRTLYASHMNLAQHAWDTGGIGRVDELLDQHRPKPGETDLRGFEWHYLHRLCHAELLTLKGHTGLVLSVAYSPDGKRLASSGGGGPPLHASNVKVWDAQTGQELLSIKGQGAAFSPDGKRLACGDDGGVVKVWDAQTGQELLTVQGRTGSVTRLAFSPDGKLLTSGSHDKTLKVWDAQTGQEVHSLQGHTDRVMSVAFSPDSKRLASAGGREVKVWDAQTGQELLSLTGGSVAFSPDGERLAGGSGNLTVKVWDAQTGQELLTLKGAGGAVAFSLDGKRLGSGDVHGVLKVWDSQTGQALLTFKGHSDLLTGVAFSPDGKNLASASFDGTVKVWDVQTGQKPLTLKGAVTSVAVAFSRDGKRLACGSGNTVAGEVKVWDPQTGENLLTFKRHSARVNGVAFSPDGKCLASGSGNNFNEDHPGELKVWDAQTGQELLNLQGHTTCVNSVAFSPDGKRLASGSGRGSNKGEVKVWDAETGQDLLTLKGNSNSVVFSPDGKRLASGFGQGSNRGEVKVWDAQTGQELLTLKRHPTDVNCVAFSPDGKCLASGCGSQWGGGHEIKLWDAQTGEELLTLKGHTVQVNSIAFSLDGKRLASASGLGSKEGEVKVWDAQTGQELLTVVQGNDWFRSVAFSPTGHWLASGAGHGTVTIYDATPLPKKP